MPIMDEIKQQRERLDQLIALVRELSESEQIELIDQLEGKKANQRLCKRKPFFNEISYADKKGVRQDFISDISETGIFIETHMPIAMGEKISLTFPVGTTNEHLKLSGEIVRKTSSGIGVKFHPLIKETQDKLRKLLDNINAT